ncbi:unnamed protein product [Spirodela intermedia]|uniref:Uncharacterized protein n=1 Tax=Spirodela intermedia TaxID=51605 RepID=A0A7I8L8Y1_SPIIN|nr:unnamed protein product [Spirodela intermedia]
MSSSQISSGDLRRPDEKSPDECERTGGRHVAVTASCPRLLSPPVDVTEETAVTEELNGRTTDVRDSPSAGVFPRPESEGTAVDAVHSPSGNEATAGEEAPSDPTIDRMINGQNQPAIKASTAKLREEACFGPGNGPKIRTVDRLNGRMTDSQDFPSAGDPPVPEIASMPAGAAISTVDLQITGLDSLEEKVPQAADAVSSVTVSVLASARADTEGTNGSLNPSVEIEINGTDSMPQLFAGVVLSCATPMTSST